MVYIRILPNSGCSARVVQQVDFPQQMGGGRGPVLAAFCEAGQHGRRGCADPGFRHKVRVGPTCTIMDESQGGLQKNDSVQWL